MVELPEGLRKCGWDCIKGSTSILHINYVFSLFKSKATKSNMDDDWDDAPTGPVQGFSGSSGFVSEGGKAFSKGRGFSAKPPSYNNGNWSSIGGKGDNRGKGGRYEESRFADKELDSWGHVSNDDEDDNWNGGGRRGGRGGGNRGRGSHRGGHGRKFNDTSGNDDAGWEKGDSNEDSWGGGGQRDTGGDGWSRNGGGRGHGNRGSRRGGKFAGKDNDNWGEDDQNDSNDNWGGNSFRRGGGRGGRRGGHRESDDNDNDWGRDDSEEGGRGRGRGWAGRGGRGRGRGGADEDAEAEEKPKREIYIPPEPTTDENEMFSSGNTTGVNFAKYDEIEVQVSGENYPKPIESFQEVGLRELLIQNVRKSGYTKPTPIQKYAIPIILAGRDLMACAQTGSGKTAAFLLPIIHTLLASPKDLVADGNTSEPQAVIVSPTRELAIQIYEEARKFSHNSIIKIVVAYGGTSVGYQRDRMKVGCHILVATPGRMNDFVKRGTLSFNSTRFVVLDEADRMLDMGFLSDIEQMMEHSSMVPTGTRQTLMFSATFPEDIQRLAAKFLDNYIFVAVGIVGGACTDVDQKFYQVDRYKKREKLVEILKEEGSEKTLVFVETKRNADFIALFLCENDFKTTSIHGDRLQRQREEALRDFKTGFRNILVATGVAARGLDIKNVKHVINYDLPKNIDEYVHRIGRTGRVGNRGKATSFYDQTQDVAIAGDLARILKQVGQPVPDWLKEGGTTSFGSHGGFGGRDVREDDFGYAQPSNVAEEPEEAW